MRKKGMTKFNFLYIFYFVATKSTETSGVKIAGYTIYCAFNDISTIYRFLCTCSKICLKLPVLHN